MKLRPRDVAGVIIGIVAIVAVQEFTGLFPPKLFKGIIGVSVAVLAVYLGFEYFSGKDFSGFSLSGRANQEDYDMKIEPVEAPMYVNQRIDELKEKYGEAKVPYRKLKLDSTEVDENPGFMFSGLPSKKLGSEVCMVKGYPKNHDAKDKVGYLVDLSVPTIRKHMADIKDTRERLNAYSSDEFDFLFKTRRDYLEEFIKRRSQKSNATVDFKLPDSEEGGDGG